MATSPTEICNLALSWLAGNRITSLEDDSDEARLCKANYNMSRRAVLEEQEWTFAIRRDEIPSLASPPLFGYQFQFLVPSTLIYGIAVYDPADANIRNEEAEQIRHSYETNSDGANIILADIEKIHIKFVGEVINTSRHSPLFDQTLAAHIAMNIAVQLTENEAHFVRMVKLFDANLDRAKSSNGMQGSREKLARSQQERVRRLFTRPA